ncbi:MAG TPA: hypothetical protein VF194_05945 [Ferrovibrio sp.]|jgi:hypothetical protein|uniref:hypothetical protein n=1 Tax=Ferrovibrio sp. TaxID=1917215 RepID=UPI002ED13C44
MRSGLFVLFFFAIRALTGIAHAAGDERRHDMAMNDEAAEDDRRLVAYPEALRIKTLANMRDHLLALSEIQAALAKDDFDAAAEIAENRLGMSSLSLHGAHEVAPLMPEGMQQAGTALHHAASRFARTAKDAGVTGDMKAALGALAETTQTCAACHAAYRLQ